MRRIDDRLSLTLAIERAGIDRSVAEQRIASPEMYPEAEMLPHLICSRPMFIGGAKDEADQHGGA
jgi:hypothetical protein